MKKRIGYIDMAKGLAIILVIIGIYPLHQVWGKQFFICFIFHCFSSYLVSHFRLISMLILVAFSGINLKELLFHSF